MVREHAAEAGYSFVGPVQVSFEQHPDIGTGVFRIRSRSRAASGATRGMPRAAGTRQPAAPQPAARQPAGALPAPAAADRVRSVTRSRRTSCPTPSPSSVAPPNADLRLEDSGVSRRHAELRYADGKVELVDLGSTNGVTVNGKPVGRAALHDGDRIDVGLDDADLPASTRTDAAVPVAVVFLLRAVVLVLLWGFVIAAVVAVRHDVFGTKPPKPAAASAGRRRPPAPSTGAGAEAARRKRRGAPPRPRSSSIEGTVSRHHRRAVVAAGHDRARRRARPSCSPTTTSPTTTPGWCRAAQDWLVEDVGSTNGTFVGDTKVTAPVVVPVGGRIKIGRNVLELRHEPAAAASAAAATSACSARTTRTRCTPDRGCSPSPTASAAPRGGEIASRLTITALMPLDTEPIADPRARAAGGRRRRRRRDPRHRRQRTPRSPAWARR